MIGKNRISIQAMLLASCLLPSGVAALAQSSQSPASQAPGSAPTPQKPENPGSTLEIPVAQPPVNAEEDADFKAFTAMPETEIEKRISAGEDFLKKYPEGRYRPIVYSALTFAYLQAGKPDKAFEIGEKEVALHPDDVQILALLSQAIPRALSARTLEPDKQLTKAEGYAKRAIELTPTMAKPEGLADQNFIAAKNSTLSMAHSGLGVVYFRRGKFVEAIPELELSLKIDPYPTPDPVNLYLLGVSDQKAAHYEDAVIAFSKCAAINNATQAACKSGAEEAKKQGATQLSSPR